MSTHNFQMTHHATVRSQQRGISQRDIDIALSFGEQRSSHGDRLHTLTDRALRDTPHADECDRLRGLCVVLTSDDVVRTTKWDFKISSRPGVLRGSALRGRQLRHESRA